MAKHKEKEIAVQLRKNGNSIKDISKKLSISTSTASYWCRDIQLSKFAIIKISQQSKAKSTKALLTYSEKQRQLRINNTALSLDTGASKLGDLTARDIYCIGLGLYWGEGYKKGNQEFGFTNSDPEMILFYIRWLRTVFGIKSDALILRVSINDLHSDRCDEVENYWSNLTNIPRSQFTKISLIKTVSKKTYQNREKHYGTLRVKVRSGTKLRREIIGAIGAVSSKLNTIDVI